MTLYAAYGSNMCEDQMRRRCPSARMVTVGHLPGFRLAFSGMSKRGGGVATIAPQRGSEVPCVVWDISSEDSLRLDRFEGVPHCYQRKRLGVEVGDLFAPIIDANVYLKDGAQAAQLAVPRDSYFDRIAAAYHHLGIDDNGLYEALAESENEVSRDSMDLVNVFVYGSLLSGFGNHAAYLHGFSFRPAKLVADLRMVSLSAFPGLVHAPGYDGPPVVGEVYEVDRETLRALDGLEGVASGFYNRVELDLVCGTTAFVYVLCGGRDAAPVPSNDWRQHQHGPLFGQSRWEYDRARWTRLGEMK